MEMQEESKGRILVVDDEMEVRMVLRRFLSMKGYTVLAARSGQEALSMLEEEAVDVVLLDLRMPEMDGFELLKAVRAAHPETAVIMLTAVADLEIAIWALKMGAADYITKPFNFDTILIGLQRALHIKRLEEENQAYTGELEKRARKRREEANTKIEEAYQQVLLTDQRATFALLSSTVMHEIRHPLSAILGNAQALETKLGEDHPLRTYCADMVAQVRQIEKLIETMDHLVGSHDEPISLTEATHDDSVPLIETAAD